MGMISGSGVANVVTVGQFTIPLMKRFGYKAAFAGGVEATASMGGQIMPPVMGAVAFIMAETLGVAYSEIAKAAIIPAILYFASAFWMVHLEAGRLNLVGLPKDKLPSALGALKERWPLLLPLAMLVYLLFAGFTPLFAGAVALALTVVIILGTSIAENLSATALRYIFWIVLGLICSALFSKGFEIGGVKAQGVDIVLIVVAALIAINFAVRGGRETLVIGTMTLTGVATIFGGWVVSIGQASIFASLVLTMLTSLVLGMGIPTIPTYIITSSLAAPALLKLGVPLIVSHMFVFYFGIIADLTPPVALAAFAAAPIAKESGFKIGFQAVRIAMAGFVIPYVAVYDPALMLQGTAKTALGYPVDVVWVVFTTSLAIGLWGVAAIGYFRRALTWFERVLALLAAVLIVGATPLSGQFGIPGGPFATQIAGVALGLGLMALEALTAKRQATA
jgi:TRAP transporter 4TM/12TM fusion protein